MVDNMPLHPKQMIDEPEETPWYTLTHPNGRQIHTVGRQWFDHAQQLYSQHAHERWDSADGEMVRPPWQLVLRYVMPQEMEALLHYNGFKIVARYNDYREAAITEEAFGFIYLCEKLVPASAVLPLVFGSSKRRDRQPSLRSPPLHLSSPRPY